ncbi:thiamine-binding protein [Bernardetia sp.]|uniref:thiamine-binding protein n=1 Tax=Bernardetia sp. TaxID=1937974 RepID=UPI0025C29829|nr:thiamine-binding protein [Bernardetia sp.]
MIVSVEISVYPLVEDYKPAVKSFIKIISQNSNLKILVNGISTHIFGELSEVMPSLEKAIESCFEAQKASVVVKFLGTDLSEYEYKG